MTFEELGLSQKVLAAVQTSGYTTPTPIQAQAIPPALQGRDILGIAQTGTGKTAAFTLPMLSRLESGRARARMPRTLILEPTRELAAQVEASFAKYGKNHRLNVALLIGGVAFGEQETKIMRGADVLIATPGRLLDFFDRGKLLLTGIEILVIDEADRMLDMGFIPDIERVCKLVPFTRQTLFFSATMPPEITRLTEAFLHNPIRCEVSRAATTATTIRQVLVASRGHADKRETLRKLIRDADNFKNAIIFCNRKRDVATLHRSLVKHGFSAGALHGDMDQLARMASLDAFKNGDVSLIVCSDVAARGLDIPDVSHVLNFDVPTHSEDYVHRIGRTGRAGRSGVAITLVTGDDMKYIDQIQSLIGKAIDWEGPGFDALPPPMETSPQERRGERAERGPRRERGRRPAAAEGEARVNRRPAATEREAPVTRRPAAVEGEAGAHHRRPAAEREAPVSMGRTRGGRAKAEGESLRTPAYGAPAGAPVADRRERRPRHHEDDGPPVIGLGDHVPSFLLRPVALRPAKVGEE
ncbi:DEAD/DEAH box helicase [Methylocystis sp. SB2]|uniref:DEAD/DEAH box helicase n=1 Tax=Methylocystis sp. (strain SB2) TaxID=743836 RepID=UPI000405A410|nr:DEAD/DEAH box helicase [Methylocystis sp. SB2]ULO24619.1 DEAD/DEAH box helicase [Methylocystis sp. SB2]